jgi:hypothetical protein
VAGCGDGVCQANETGCTCPADCGGCACTHSLCTTGLPLAWTCDPCARALCDIDPYCCVAAWDPVCVWNVPATCGLSCGGTCGDFLCDYASGETCLTCPGDCGRCAGM